MLSDSLNPLAAILHGIESSFSYAKLEADPAVIYLLDPELRIAFCNRAWDDFALRNGGPELVRARKLGFPVLDAIPTDLRSFYAEAFAFVASSGKPWEHDFECSSAESFRSMHMRVLPLPDGFLLVENSLRVERPYPELGYPPLTEVYRDERGLIVMCAHCRRVRRCHEKLAWDWVPAFVTKIPQNTSHGLCKSCRAFYFGS